MKISFTVPGNPFGKQRPRFGRGRAYTPKETVEYEKLVAEECMKAMKLQDALMFPDDMALGVSINAYCPVPKSWSKRKQNDAILGLIAPTSKPDIDNIVKSVLDGMQDVLYSDDKTITRIVVQKIYSNTPRVHVEVYVI